MTATHSSLVALVLWPVLMWPASAPAAEPAASQPTSTQSAMADWPGFAGAGRLLGRAGELPPPLSVRWTFPIGQAEVVAPAAIVGDSVYVADDAGVLHAIDLATGQERWTYDTGQGFQAGPLVADGRVFIGDITGRMHAVNARTGEPLWTRETHSTIHAPANVSDGRVLMVNDDGTVLALSAADGEIAWSYQAGTRVNSALAVGPKLAVLADCDAKMVGLAGDDGAMQFEFGIGQLTGGSPVLAGEAIIVATDAGRVASYSRTGQMLWEYTDVAEQAMVYATPAEADGVVVVGARDGAVHAMATSTGRPMWKFQTGGDVDGSAVICGQVVYVAGKDGRLYALDLRRGTELWRFTGSRGFAAGPAVGRGVLVIGDQAGNVYCLQGKTKE